MKRMEEILSKPCRDHGAYRVPEGYFDSLNERIMSALPDEERQTPRGIRWRMTPRVKYAAAACITALAMITGTTLYCMHGSEAGGDLAANATPEMLTDEYVQECMDYAMVDGNDMYAFIAEQ